MKLAWFRFLDWLQSSYRYKTKEIASKRKYGPEWKNCVRPGRKYSHLQFMGYQALEWKREGAIISKTTYSRPHYEIRHEPGWEWHCPNCHDYSIITESMMPEILQEYEDRLKAMLAVAKPGFQAPPRPTAAMAGCPNCKYRPGAPE